MHNNIFPPKTVSLNEIMWEDTGGAEQATDDNRPMSLYAG